MVSCQRRWTNFNQMCQHYVQSGHFCLFAQRRRVKKDMMIFQIKTVTIYNAIIQLLSSCILKMLWGDGKWMSLYNNQRTRDRIWKNRLPIIYAWTAILITISSLQVHYPGFNFFLLAVMLFVRKFFVLHYQCTHCEHKHSRLRAFLERLNNWFNIIAVKASLKSLSKASIILLSAGAYLRRTVMC